MTQIVVIDRTGGPEVLVSREVALAPPGPGEVLLRHAAIGVNFVDVYHRTGLYALPPLPAALGVDGAGVVEALGAGVEGVAVGDRVAYALPVGAYAAKRLMPSTRLVKLPEAISLETAAAVMLKGITAHMLLHRVHRMRAGETLLLHGAAGGLGLLILGWAKRLDVRVIGVVGTAEKAELARAHGLDLAIERDADFVAAVRDWTAGRGVDHAIDGIGGATLARTLDAMAPFGMVSSIGQVAGAIPPIDPTDLGPRRSIALARPSVFAHASDLAAYRQSAAALFEHLIDGDITVAIGARWPLAAAAEAHRALEAGRTSGSILLVP